MIQKHIANIVDFTDDKKGAADINGDGVVNIFDATSVQKYIAQLIDSLG